MTLMTIWLFTPLKVYSPISTRAITTSLHIGSVRPANSANPWALLPNSVISENRNYQRGEPGIRLCVFWMHLGHLFTHLDHSVCLIILILNVHKNECVGYQFNQIRHHCMEPLYKTYQCFNQSMFLGFPFRGAGGGLKKMVKDFLFF